MYNGVALTAAIRSAPQIPFQGLTYRAIHLQYFPVLANAQPLYTSAGGPIGSRYIEPGGPQALYVALEADTAFRELNQIFLQQAATPLGATQVVTGQLRPAPYVTLGIHVELTRVLDLTDLAVRRHLGIRSIRGLLGRWRGVSHAPTQVLGAAVFASNRFEGILYPSAQHRGYKCLIAFRSRITFPCHIHFHDAKVNLIDQIP